MTNYWILVSPRKQVKSGVAGGYVQADHGKAHPLRRMGVGDGLICYSPKLEFGGDVACQSFTAIGCVVGEEVYKFDMGDNFLPHRREVKYLMSRDTPIAPLINRLAFIKDKASWGHIFKYSIIHISAEDFKYIATTMNANIK